MTTLEYLGALLGVFYVILAIPQNRACWLLYGLSAILYVPVLLHQQMPLYAAMQIFFAASAWYGWREWGRESAQTFSIKTESFKFHLSLIAVGIVLTIVCATALTLIVPPRDAIGDAAITVFSIVATILTAKKSLSSWAYWIAVNIAAIAIYGIKGMVPTAVLYLVNLVFAGYGYVKWKRADTSSLHNLQQTARPRPE